MRNQKLPLRLFYLVLNAGGGLFTLFWASVFFLGSKYSAHQMLAEQGVVALFLKRFLSFAVLGGLIALGSSLLSIGINTYRRQPNWSEPKHVFKRALLLQLLCALLGSAVFMVSMSGSKPEE